MSYPLKEFTVFPKDKNRQRPITMEEVVEHEILLMLKEDGSFQQYADDEKTVQIPDKLKYHKADDAVLERFLGKIQGKWDLVDGKLILAADRPVSQAEDTLLVGEVVATSEVSLSDNPMLQIATNDNANNDKGKINNNLSNDNAMSTGSFDTHLSIPKGEVNVGKFMYPRHHPSFFEQPMWRPTRKGKFALKQVLGLLNTQNVKKEDELVEKFRAKDFYGKRFLLTSYPLGNRRPKGNIRWSIKYNKYVEDAPSQKAKKQAEEEENRPVNIRVMEVMFFANNTFATVGGLGEATVLRGKYHIIGHDRDQLWMQVWRFGFGRSVSGSVYSEGKGLTKEDEKCYWGKISYMNDQPHGATSSKENKSFDPKESNNIATPHNENATPRLSVEGSVIFGYGLEPLPVARFVMTETTATGEDDDDDDVDDDDEDHDIDTDDEPKDEFLDWSNSFQ